VLREYTMNKIENISDSPATIMSRAKRADTDDAAHDQRHRGGQAELMRTPLTRWRAGGAGGFPGNVNLIRHVCFLAKGDA
jgi:hypothetical protein